jgi:hypothetical protein
MLTPLEVTSSSNLSRNKTVSPSESHNRTHCSYGIQSFQTSINLSKRFTPWHIMGGRGGYDSSVIQVPSSTSFRNKQPKLTTMKSSRQAFRNEHLKLTKTKDIRHISRSSLTSEQTFRNSQAKITMNRFMISLVPLKLKSLKKKTFRKYPVRVTNKRTLTGKSDC